MMNPMQGSSTEIAVTKIALSRTRGSPVTDPQITIPADLLPADGRFGCGPSKVRPEAVAALAGVATTYLGTSHRQATVRNEVARVRRGLAQLFSLPEGYEVVLGNGGTTAFWEAAVFGLIKDRAQFLTFGEFGSKFAKAAKIAPFLGDPSVI
jgi:phosphoserine aminotransferase